MLAIIRISGLVNVRKEVSETLDRLRLRKKYACNLIDEKRENVLGMIEKVRDFIAYGQIDEKTLVELLKARGKDSNGKKIIESEANKFAKDLMNGKKMQELGLKPFFALHPPRKGIKSKLHYPKGALGNHRDKINELILRML